MRAFLFLLLITTTTSLAQSPRQIQYDNPGLIEKVYVHTDRDTYLAGEPLWFACYLTGGTSEHLATISNIVKIELISNEGASVLQSRISIANGIGNGSFYLPASFPSGTYTLRAYTQWMQNRHPNYFFRKKITIINTFKDPESTYIQPKEEVTFYPESGHILANLPNRIAFRFKNSILTQASLVDQTGRQISETIINPGKPAEFLFTPEPEKTYFVKSGSEGKSYPLPAVMERGAYLHSNYSNSKIVVKSGFISGGAYQLIIHSNKEILYSKSIQQETSTDSINLEILPSAIVYVTLLDQNKNPLSERVHYHYAAKQQVKLEFNQATFNRRREVKAELKSTRTLAGNFSISVFKEDSILSSSGLPPGPYLNVAAELGLGSNDLVDCFTPEGEPLPQLELYLRTTSARKFQPTTTNYSPEMQGPILQAMVTRNQEPVEGVRIFFAAPSKQSYFTSGISDKNGMVSVEIQQTYSSQRMYLVCDPKSDSLIQLSPVPSFYPPVDGSDAGSINFQGTPLKSLEARSIAMQLYDIYHPAQHTTYQIPSDSLPVYGVADEYYNLDDYTRFPVMEEVLREIVRSVYVRKRQKEFRLRIVNSEKKEVFDENPLVLIDGIPEFNLSKIMNLDPLTIKRVDIVSRKFYRGSFVAEGIISLKTYNGDLAGFEPDKSTKIVDFEGLQEKRIFYSPDYNANPAPRIPDQRYLLYWNPEVKGTTPIRFYTSDVTGNFVAVVAGMLTDGTPVSTLTRFTVD